MLTLILFVVFITLFAYYLYLYYGREKYNPNFTVPKGPRGIPFFGNILQLGRRPYITLFKWSNKYGPVFRVRLGSQDIVVLNGTKTIRDALLNKSEEFAGRPKLYMIHATLKGKGLISSPYNKDYSEHKQFLLNSFNRFARRRSSLEVTCLESTANILNEFRDNPNDSFISNSKNLKNKLSQIASQNVLQIAFGAPMHDQKNLSKLMDLIAANFQNTSVSAAFNFFPFVRYFKSSILKNVMKCSDFLKELVHQRMSDYDPNGVHNVTDAYLTELLNNMNFREKPIGESNLDKPYQRPRYKSFSFDHLNSMVQDLFVAGTETISNTLNWAIIYVTYFTNCQVKIHEEIDRLLGKEKQPCENDRLRMHYIEAFLNETMRYHCAGPILVPRSTTVATEIHGYKIPEETFIMVNMWSCMRDPEYWNEPDKFNPERFLDKNGFFKGDNPAMIPFSIGKRACTGESLARIQLFLIFTRLLQKYRFEFANKEQVKSKKLLDGIPGITLSCSNVPLKIMLR